jgi:REP element-mobilizing transposase RayT
LRVLQGWDMFDFRLVGYVLMPEHVHLLISEPKKSNVSRVLQVLKQRVSRAMKRKAGPPAALVHAVQGRRDDSARSRGQGSKRGVSGGQEPKRV